jgi:GTPase
MDVMVNKPLPLVSLVGRPNVGKSTLFNRLIGRRMAIVDDAPGVTRDRIFGRSAIEGRPVYLVDTGGLTMGTGKTEMERNIEKQILMSFESSAVLVMIVDAMAGVMPEDAHAAEVLRRYDRPVIVAANKSESAAAEAAVSDFFKLGFGEPVAISALHGMNVDILAKRIAPLLPESDEAESGEPPVRFCVVGRPNVGKSSLVNAILGEERCVVSSVAGTTRDRVDADFSRDGRPFVIVDTAGMKRRRTKMDRLEFFGSRRARAALLDSGVAVLVLDAMEGIYEGDKHIIGAIVEEKKGLVIAVNKMDLVGDTRLDKFKKYLRAQAPFLPDVPIVFTSAIEGRGIEELFDALSDVHSRMNVLLPLELLKNVIYDVRALYSPGSKGRRFGEIKGVVHDRTGPPRIVIKVNDPALFHTGYVRLIENQIRKVFDLRGVPLDLTLAGPAGRK